jgi:hypothetical protein
MPKNISAYLFSLTLITEYMGIQKISIHNEK